jgi:hypothetical protein
MEDKIAKWRLLRALVLDVVRYHLTINLPGGDREKSFVEIS